MAGHSKGWTAAYELLSSQKTMNYFIEMVASHMKIRLSEKEASDSEMSDSESDKTDKDLDIESDDA